MSCKNQSCIMSQQSKNSKSCYFASCCFFSTAMMNCIKGPQCRESAFPLVLPTNWWKGSKFMMNWAWKAA